ncbi:MAG: FHA domain-containing protein FhaB/FipA [Mycobacteriales bacterium]
MGSALVVAVVKFGLLGLLWVFVLLAVRTMRADLGGQPRAAAAPPVPAPKAPRAPKPPRRKGVAHSLVVTEGSLQGTTVTLADSPITLGRAHDSTLVLTDDYASNRHARLYPTGDGWTLEDLGSTNGTYLGTTKVSRPTAVPVGTQIRIGKTVMELRS